MKKLYQGRRGESGAQVTVTDDNGTRPLPLCLEIINHSPDGFEWGYGGSGPAQLALALCVDALGGNNKVSGPCAGIDDTGACEPLCKCALTEPHIKHKCACGNSWYKQSIERARRIYQQFKFAHIAVIDDDGFAFTGDQVECWIRDLGVSFHAADSGPMVSA
jgi:hypothetical protein